MEKQPEKETLTDDLIRIDILNSQKTEGRMAINVILSVVCVFFIFLFSFFSPYVLLALLFPAAFLISSYIGEFTKSQKIQNMKFEVITDKFLYDKQGELRTDQSFYKGQYISYLQFENSGRWELEGRYYTWSEINEMSASGICHTSFPGDTFYLVIDKKNRTVLMGYNTNFFDYKNN